MGHVFARIMELLVANGLAAVVTLIFAIAIYSIVHGLRTVGRHQ